MSTLICGLKNNSSQSNEYFTLNTHYSNRAVITLIEQSHLKATQFAEPIMSCQVRCKI